jgi:D-alanyl-D-alanine dipeptidase
MICLASSALAKGHQPAALRTSTQILVVTTSDWNAVAGTLQPYERKGAHGRWKAVGPPIPVVVGQNGLGWGAGAAPEADLGRRGAGDSVPLGPVKREGDDRSPAGIFRLGTSFGYAASQPAEWKMPYVSLTPSVECVDDPHSKFYNRVLDRATVSPDWKSSEQMLRSDELYRWGLVVDHNTDPVTPGVGSCVFLHIWPGAGRGTSGCTAMEEKNLETLLAWLDPARKPLLVQLPRPQYQRLRRRWKLPALPRQE